MILRAFLIVGLTVGAAASAHGQTVPFSDSRWKLSGDSTRVETVAGREILRLETGEARLPDIRFRDGTIDVDVMTTRRRSFVYLNFRVESDGEQEEFYLRPHKSSLPDAAQYAPAFQGEGAWQLYYGSRGTASPLIEPDVWQHLRIVVSGEKAAFFLGDTVKPFMVLPHLAREARPGYIALRSFVPAGTPQGPPAARFTNLSIRANVVAYDFSATPPPARLPAGVVQRWEVGQGFAAPDSAISVMSGAWSKTFTTVTIEPDGFVELHRHVRVRASVQRYVGAVTRFRVSSTTAGLHRFEIGFSDRATVFVNGKPMFFGENSYDFENRRDGLISFNQASVYLPLRAGLNEVSVVVTDRFGGWAIMGRFPDMRGLTITP